MIENRGNLSIRKKVKGLAMVMSNKMSMVMPMVMSMMVSVEMSVVVAMGR